MNQATKKADTPLNKNQEAIDTLEARLEELGEQKVTLPALLELATLTDTIKVLKQNPDTEIF